MLRFPLIHDPDDFMTQALDSAYPALAELRAAGVVGAIGVGMNAAAPLAWFVSRADLDCVLVADPRDGAHYDYVPASAEVLARARRIRDTCAGYGVPAAALRPPRSPPTRPT